LFAVSLNEQVDLLTFVGVGELLQAGQGGKLLAVALQHNVSRPQTSLAGRRLLCYSQNDHVFHRSGGVHRINGQGRLERFRAALYGQGDIGAVAEAQILGQRCAGIDVIAIHADDDVTCLQAGRRSR